MFRKAYSRYYQSSYPQATLDTCRVESRLASSSHPAFLSYGSYTNSFLIEFTTARVNGADCEVEELIVDIWRKGVRNIDWV